jgi:hypothetical protein
MRTKCKVQSVVTFDDLGLVLQVDRGDGWAMLAHQLTGQSLGVFLRDSAGLSWMVCCVTSCLTFDNLELRLVVSRAAGCAMLVHLGEGISLGVFVRKPDGLLWVARSEVDFGNPPAEVWGTISTMI